MLGISIHRDRSRGIFHLSQKDCIDKVLNGFGMQFCKSGITPISKGDKFSLILCPKSNLEIKQMQEISFASAIGNLMYVQLCTLSVIAFIVDMLGRCLCNSSLDYWKSVKRVLRYLQRTKEYMLTF